MGQNYRGNISLTQAGLVRLNFLKIIQSMDGFDLTEILINIINYTAITAAR